MSFQSVNAAPGIAALFVEGVLAHQTSDTISADTLLAEERPSLLRAAPKRVHEFAAGRACARAGLAQLGYAEIAILSGADRAPRWPAGATGSITHTDGFCAAVVARTTTVRALGVDVEPAASVRPHLWPRICTPKELQVLSLQDESSALAAATLIFSAKEAFYKCQYTLTQEWLGFADLRIIFDAGRFTVHPCRSLQIAQLVPGPWEGRYLHAGGRVITGLCIV